MDGAPNDPWAGPPAPRPPSPPTALPPTVYVPQPSARLDRPEHRSPGGRWRSRAIVGAVFLLIAGVIVGGVAFQREMATHRSPEELGRALNQVCTKDKGLSDIPAYERGERGQLAAVEGSDVRPPSVRSLDEGDDLTRPLDEDRLEDVRVMLCIEQVESLATTSCSYGLGGMGYTVDLTTKARFAVDVVEVHSGDVLAHREYELSRDCPGTIRIKADQSVSSPEMDGRTDRAVLLAAAFHRGA